MDWSRVQGSLGAKHGIKAKDMHIRPWFLMSYVVYCSNKLIESQEHAKQLDRTQMDATNILLFIVASLIWVSLPYDRAQWWVFPVISFRQLLGTHRSALSAIFIYTSLVILAQSINLPSPSPSNSGNKKASNLGSLAICLLNSSSALRSSLPELDCFNGSCAYGFRSLGSATRARRRILSPTMRAP